MATLGENINRTINDFDSIKEAIENKGISVGNVPTNIYAEKIYEIAEVTLQDNKTVILSTDTDQTITPDAGYDGLSSVTVPRVTSAIDDNIQASNIAEGVSILGVSGVVPPIIYSDTGRAYTYNLIIPDIATVVGNNAYQRARQLQSVYLPDSITSIQNYAFYLCDNLHTINIPSNAIMGANVFPLCCRLQHVTVGAGFDSNLDISASVLYSVDTLTAIFNALKDNTGLTAKTLKIGATNIAKLTPEQLQIATNKNWNVA